jgi:hypothetical protein
MFANPLTEKLASFVRGIGIDVRAMPLTEPTFLPGIDIRDGAIVVDEERLAHPGDLLHEAGHLAVAAPAERNAPRLTPSDGDEIAAQAWSYAAVRHLELDPAIVFHGEGYRGSAKALIENFAAGRTFGQPLLQYYGMTVELRHAENNGVPPYPHVALAALTILFRIQSCMAAKT